MISTGRRRDEGERRTLSTTSHHLPAFRHGNASKGLVAMLTWPERTDHEGSSLEVPKEPPPSRLTLTDPKSTHGDKGAVLEFVSASQHRSKQGRPRNAGVLEHLKRLDEREKRDSSVVGTLASRWLRQEGRQESKAKLRAARTSVPLWWCVRGLALNMIWEIGMFEI